MQPCDEKNALLGGRIEKIDTGKILIFIVLVEILTY